jgi:hypothetical protein
MIKRTILPGIFALLFLFAGGCADTKTVDAAGTPGTVEISFDFSRQSGIANNQFAVWIEDSRGKFVKSLYVTGFSGKGGFRQRPEALPEWVKRSGAASKEQADLTAGATPKSGAFTATWNCTDEKGAAVAAGDYSFFVEETVAWKDDLYKGVIVVGDKRASASPEAVSKTSADNDMIGEIKAVFTPAETK